MIKYNLRKDNISSRLFISQRNAILFHQKPFPSLEAEPISPEKKDGLTMASQSTKAYTNEKLLIDDGCKSMGVQTDYREEWTQSDPYTPKEVINPKLPKPEVLRLANFKYGKELPPTIKELLLIEEMRERALFDNALPPLSDEIHFSLRRKLMETQEVYEWQKRENEIKKRQNKKLELLDQMLEERERAVEQRDFERISNQKDLMNREKNILIAKLQSKNIQALRKLSRIEQNFVAIAEKPSRSDKYSNFGSSIYAPLLRDGSSVETLIEKIKEIPKPMTSYQLFLKFKDSIEHENIYPNKPSLEDVLKRSSLNLTKIQRNHLSNLTAAREAMEDKINMKYSRVGEGLYEINIQNVIPRPDTPYLEERDELCHYPHQEVNMDKTRLTVEEDRLKSLAQKNLLAGLLQRLLRGRAVQNLMFEGKEKRLALIDELLIVANTEDKGVGEEEEILKREKEQERIKTIAEQGRGKYLSAALDLLNQELLREIEENNLAEFAQMAEEDRRRREVTETGRRQAELIIKVREEKLFKESLNICQETANNFLNDIFSRSSSFLAQDQATTLTKIREQKFNNYVNKNNENLEVLVRDFLQGYLIPNIDRDKLRRITRENDMKNFNKLFQNSNSFNN